MNDFRFCYQDNQFNGECKPCTIEVFNSIVDRAEVAWKISTRQEIEDAIAQGQPLDEWLQCTDFKEFCQKQENNPKTRTSFLQLGTQQRLIQWVSSLKMSLPCFIFGASGFDLQTVTDKEEKPVLDRNGKPKKKRLRKLTGIHLSGLFMFDGDHLPMSPRELYERTQVPGFPWRLRLAHATSSGHGLRLVCEARPELGNIADNQICLARELGLMGMIGTTGKPVVDDSCIDASRISYACRREDIYFIDEENLFNIND